jgi:mannose-1-phosphate guanylyltransferase
MHCGPPMKSAQTYVVILAGGDGSRLAQLTRALYGTELPKQFAVLAGERSLLQTTIERAMDLTSLDRISVVVTAHQEGVARTQVAPYPGIELVVQSRNLDTAPGMLAPLVRILARARDARVVFLPSDHYISNVEPLWRALRAAERALHSHIALAGVAPTGPEVEYGWIVPGARIAYTDAFTVQCFEEKPQPGRAAELWEHGGLWNTFIQAGPAHAFWELARQHLPRHTAALERCAATVDSADETESFAAAYRAMPAANFSRDVLAHATELAVLPISDSGWSDWGSPRRVFASLAGTPNHDRLLARIRGDFVLGT